VLAIIQQRLRGGDVSEGFVLDGFPRNETQALDLEGVLSETGQQLDAVILMDVELDVLMKRLTGRRTCSTSGKLLNVYFSPQAELDACINAGGELVQRADDNEATISNRLEVYERETAPLIDFYRDRGNMRTVKAEGSPGEVYSRLLAVLAAVVK
jgi:adenylate kinase